MRYWLFAYCCQVAWASAGTETIEGSSSTGPQVLTAGAFVFFLVLGTVLLLQSGSLQEAERGLGLRAAGGRRSRSQSRVTFGGDCPIHCKHHREGRSLLDGCSGLQRDGKSSCPSRRLQEFSIDQAFEDDVAGSAGSGLRSGQGLKGPKV